MAYKLWPAWSVRLCELHSHCGQGADSSDVYLHGSDAEPSNARVARVKHHDFLLYGHVGDDGLHALGNSQALVAVPARGEGVCKEVINMQPCMQPRDHGRASAQDINRCCVISSVQHAFYADYHNAKRA